MIRTDSTPEDVVSPLGMAVVKTFIGWTGLLGQLGEGDHRKVVRFALRMLAAQLPCNESATLSAAVDGLR